MWIDANPTISKQGLTSFGVGVFSTVEDALLLLRMRSLGHRMLKALQLQGSQNVGYMHIRKLTNSQSSSCCITGLPWIQMPATSGLLLRILLKRKTELYS